MSLITPQSGLVTPAPAVVAAAGGRRIVEIDCRGSGGQLSGTAEIDGYTFDVRTTSTQRGGLQIAIADIFDDYNGDTHTVSAVMQYSGLAAPTGYGGAIWVLNPSSSDLVRMYQYNTTSWFQIASSVDFDDNNQVSGSLKAAGTMALEAANGAARAAFSGSTGRNDDVQVGFSEVWGEAAIRRDANGRTASVATAAFDTTDEVFFGLADFVGSGTYTVTQSTQGIAVSRATASIILEKIWLGVL